MNGMRGEEYSGRGHTGTIAGRYAISAEPARVGAATFVSHGGCV